MNYSMIWMLNL